MRGHIPTAAFRPMVSEDAIRPRGAMPAVVLTVYSASDQAPSWYRGPVCDVLLLDRMAPLSGVVIPGGGGARNQAWVLPDETDPEVVRHLYQEDGEPPSLTGPDAALWGSFVLVCWMDCGLPYISESLAHPARRVTAVPTGESREEPERIPGQGEVDYSQLPSEIADLDSVPKPRIPVEWAAEGARDAYRSAYEAYWYRGAAEAWWYGERSTESLVVPLSAGWTLQSERNAFMGGAQAGFDDGQTYGLSVRGRTPPTGDTYEGEPYDWQVTPVEPGAADEESENEIPATAGRGDLSIEEHGVRVVIRPDGTFLVDLRDAAGLRVQGSGTGVRVTANGAILDVGATGNVVDVRGATVNIHAGGDAEQSFIRGEDHEAFMRTVFSVPTAMGPSGPMTPTYTEGVLSKHGKVN